MRNFVAISPFTVPNQGTNLRYLLLVLILVLSPVSFSAEVRKLSGREVVELEKQYDENFERNYLKCLEISKTLLNNDKSLGIELGSEKHLMMYARALKMNSLYSQSLQVYYNLLKIKKSSTKRSKILHQIGLVYDDMGEFRKANNYYRKVIELTEDSIEMIPTLHALADNYTLLKQFDSSHYYFQKLKPLIQTNDSPEELALIHFASMECLVALKNEEEIKKSAAYFSFLQDKNISEYTGGYGYYALGFYHQYQGNIDSSVHYFSKTVEVCEQIGYISALKNVYRSMVELFLEQNNFEEAFRFEMLRDSIEHVLLTDKEFNMVNAFEAEFDAFEKKNKIYDQQIELLNKSKQINAIVLGLLSLLVILLILVFYVRRTRKMNAKLVSQNYRIDFLLRELNHRVKNNLQLLSSLIGLQINRVPNEDNKKNLEEIRYRLLTLGLLHNLLDGEQKNKSLNELIPDLFTRLKKAMTTKEVKLDLELDDIDLDEKKLSLIALLLNEIFTNFLKYGMTNSNPTLKVIGSILTQKYELQIQDNGRDSKQSKEGLGTKIIQSLTKQLKGDLKIIKDLGYTYIITFPISK